MQMRRGEKERRDELLTPTEQDHYYFVERGVEIMRKTRNV